MRNRITMFVLAVLVVTCTAGGEETMPKDTFTTSAGPLEMTFIGHGTLMFRLGETVIHVDPWSRLADYATLPKADIVLVTHEHGDHLDADALETVRAQRTVIVCPASCASSIEGATVMKNGDSRDIDGIGVAAVPAYNIVHKRQNGEPFHPKGRGNGYVLTMGDTRVYVAGDTENVPEMRALEDIDIAFLPMNLPYTMTPEMAAEAARMFRPGVLYPYHYGETDASKLADILKDDTGIEVRIRDLQ